MSLPSEPEHVYVPMGRFAMVPVGIIQADLSPMALRLWCALATFQNHRHKAWPSTETLLENLPDGTVRRSIGVARDELITKGLISYESKNGTAGDLYTLFHPISRQDAERYAPVLGQNGEPPDLSEQTRTDQNRPRTETTQSSKLDAAKDILEFFNARTGKRFPPVTSNLRLIQARLRESTPDRMRAIIAIKIREWRNDPKAWKWMRPKTIFNATNYAQYEGELPATAFAPLEAE